MYARISRDEAGDGLGVERQLEDCRKLVDQRGWQLVESFIDNDVSAYSTKARPAYVRLLTAVGAGHIDTVVAWAPERLHRAPRELEDFIELMERTGTRVETVKAGTWDVSSSHGRLVARMLGAVSRAESERIGERVSRAHQQAKGDGYWRGPIPFGMRASGRPGEPEEDPIQAPVVREILTEVGSGRALTQIASQLNSRGVRPRRGQAWTHTSILRLVSSPALGGLVDVGGELRRARFEGIVDPDEWLETRAALRRRPRGEQRRPREKLTLLGGILRCVEHGHVCVGGSSSHAATYVAGMPSQCFVSITRAAADSVVEEVVLARLAMPDAAAAFSDKQDEQGLAHRARELRRRRDELAQLVAEGLLPAATARPKLLDLARQLAEIDAEQHPLRINREVFRDPRGVWDRWQVMQKRDVVKLLFEKVEVKHVGHRSGPRADPTRISFTWRDA